MATPRSCGIARYDVARRMGCATRSGAAFDAWVDKTLHVNLAWALAVADRIPDWYVAAWCARELIQGPSVVFLMHRFRTATAPPPRTSLLGRATAVTLSASVLAVLLGYDALYLTIVTGVLGTLAGLHYMTIYVPKKPLRLPGSPGEAPKDPPHASRVAVI